MSLENKKAVVCVSGGLDSTTCLAIAKSEGYDCSVLTFDYGQRNRIELEAAKRVVKAFDITKHRIFKIDINQWGASAMTDHALDIPHERSDDVPITYVPARNTIFLSLALAWAETLGAADIFIGANAIDYSNYPDCRPEYIAAFENMANLATRAGVEGQQLKIHTPLILMTKSDIVKQGAALGVDYGITLSCYDPIDGLACGECDACYFRAKGFTEAGVSDPTKYVAEKS